MMAVLAVLAGRSSSVSSGWVVARREDTSKTETTRTVCARYRATVIFPLTTAEA